MGKCRRWSLVVAIVAALGGVRATAAGSDASFGDTLTGDTTLQSDLSGSGTGLVIGASGITVDLNGHTLTMTSGNGWGIDNTGGYDNVTIKNGRIEGFDEGVRAVGADGFTLSYLEVDGATGSGATSAAVHVFDSADVRVQNCAVTLEPVFGGPHAIRFDSVAGAKVQNCEIDGGFTGVAFFSADWQNGNGDPTTGSIQGCTIADCASSGVLLGNTTSAYVQGNEISGCPAGMQIGITSLLPPTGVHVADNAILDSLTGGLDCRWLKDSKITGNEIKGSAFFGLLLRQECTGNHVANNDVSENGFRGIVINLGSNGNRITGNEVNDNGLDGIALFTGASTGNRITGNTATGNGVWDLFHNAASSPNTWEDNDYDTASGGDIG